MSQRYLNDRDSQGASNSHLRLFATLRRYWRALSLQAKTLLMACVGLVGLPLVLVLLGTFSYLSSPPVPSPYVHPSDEVRAIYWNGWASTISDPFSPTRRFSIESDYEVFLDLSGFDYSSWDSATVTKEAGPEFIRILRKWLDNSKSNSAKLRILFLPDMRFFDSPSNGGVTEMQVDLAAVRRAFEHPESQPSDLSSIVKPKLDWLFGRASVQLHTHKRTGLTAIGISIWDGIRPVDELSVPVCIGSDVDCKGPPAINISLKGFDSLRLADQRSTDPQTFPDGALHFLQLSTGPVIGVFHRRDWADDRFLSWRLGDNAKSLRAWLKDKLIPAFNVASKREELTERGMDLFDRLFPDDPEGRTARQEFQQFFHNHRSDGRGAPASVFVRMLPQDDDPLPILPIGLMAVPVAGQQPDFLGLQFRVEIPLESQDYRPSPTCVSNWVMLLPPEDAAPELRSARERVAGYVQRWVDTRIVYEDIPSFRGWARTADSESPSTVLATLSHHDRDRLYFSTESIMSTAFHRQFANPSMAILSGCGTANIAATDIVRALNGHGVSAVIATSTEISPILGADFLSTLDDTLVTHEPTGMRLGMLMFETLRTLASKAPSQTAGPYGPSVLAFTLLGNGNLQICAPPKKGEPK